MKKLLLFTLTLLVLSCTKDLDYDVVEYTIVPEKLVLQKMLV